MSVEDYIVIKIKDAFAEVEQMIPEMSLDPDERESFKVHLKEACGTTCSWAAGAIARATLETKSK